MNHTKMVNVKNVVTRQSAAKRKKDPQRTVVTVRNTRQEIHTRSVYLNSHHSHRHNLVVGLEDELTRHKVKLT